MRVIIAGARDFWHVQTVYNAIQESGFDVTECVHGCAPGVDTVAGVIASEMSIPIREFPADWERHGKAAGPIRNGHMAQSADALIALWRGNRGGTWNMITQAVAKGLKVYIKMIPCESKDDPR